MLLNDVVMFVFKVLVCLMCFDGAASSSFARRARRRAAFRYLMDMCVCVVFVFVGLVCVCWKNVVVIVYLVVNL